MKMPTLFVIAVAILLSLAPIANAQDNILLNGSVAVPAGNYWRVEFLTGRGGNAVQGRFRAEGGSNNDIFCYIVDSDGFENFRNGNQFRYFYASGRVTVADINVALPADTMFYLIFSNKHAWLAPKTVYGRIELNRP